VSGEGGNHIFTNPNMKLGIKGGALKVLGGNPH
jgi:hypothetical protein